MNSAFAFYAHWSPTNVTGNHAQVQKHYESSCVFVWLHLFFLLPQFLPTKFSSISLERFAIGFPFRLHRFLITVSYCRRLRNVGATLTTYTVSDSKSLCPVDISKHSSFDAACYVTHEEKTSDFAQFYIEAIARNRRTGGGWLVFHQCFKMVTATFEFRHEVVCLLPFSYKAGAVCPLRHQLHEAHIREPTDQQKIKGAKVRTFS